MKITIEVTEKVKKEIELQFPYYTKSDYRFYKFIDENNCLEVYKGITDFSIDFSPYKTFALPYEPSTAEEFNTKFKIVKSLIESI